jgi:ribulose-phosphate 3-epimerase
MKPIIAPSILSADFGNLQRDIEMINNSNADWFHVDVMDGVFVPNISFGFPVMKTLQQHAKKTLDVHLMIVDPTVTSKHLRRQELIFFQCIMKHVHTCTAHCRPLRQKA